MQSKVLLVNAPTRQARILSNDNYFPLGLLYMATILKNNGIDVAILDINNYFYLKDYSDTILIKYLENTFREYLEEYQPNIVGIGCTFSGCFHSLKMIAQKIKEILPQTPVAVGGIHPTVFAKEILKKYVFIDYVVIGEGENTFLELVRQLSKGNHSFDSVEGLAFRKNGDIALNHKVNFIHNLDELPFIDYSLLNLREYKMDTSGWYSPKKTIIGQPFTIISSRSCPNRCNFCSMWLVHGPKFRYRSAVNVLDEMENLYENHGVRYFQFMDDNMTFNKGRTLELCQGIRKRGMDIQFDCPNGLAINRLDEEIIKAMVDAGLVRASLAIESGSEYIRNKIIKKGLSTKKIYETTEICARHKHLFIKGFFIIGLPEETIQTLQDTFEMIKNLPLDRISVNFVAPYPGTELFNYCLQHGLLSYNKEDYLEVEVFQDTDERPHFKPHNVSEEELIGFRKKCFDYMKNKRDLANIPDNYPLRYKS